MAKKGAKQKLGGNQDGEFVYSTNASFAFSGLADLLGSSEKEGQQTVEVHLEKKHRGGKAAIIIKGFSGSEEELVALSKKLKSAMGVGGSAKDGEIIIQGEARPKAMELLEKWGYKTKRVGA